MKIESKIFIISSQVKFILGAKLMKNEQSAFFKKPGPSNEINV